MDFHGAEFDAPADVAVGRGRFEAHVLPVGGLEVLEMVGFGEVEGLEIFSEDDDRVADEEVGEVCGKEVIHAAIYEALFDGFVDDKVRVHVLLSQSGVL